MLTSLPSDIRHGIRLLSRQPGFTAAALIALALGIGANTAMFTVVNSVLLRPLPYTDSARLVMVREHRQQRDFDRTVITSGEFARLAARATAIDAMATVDYPSLSIKTNGEAQGVAGLRVTASFFRALDVRPVLGRVFTEADDRPGANLVVLVSHAFWRDSLDSNPAALERPLTIDGRPYEVVGVLPPGFSFFGQVDAIVPQAFDSEAASDFGHHHLDVVARLAKGADRQAAETELTGISRTHDDFTDHAVSIALVPLQDEVVGSVRAPMLVLFACVGVVLLIACTNIANLLLTRAVGRQKEIAIRTALGANRLRIATQLLAESLLLSSLGGVLGFLLSLWGVDLIVGMSPAGLPRLLEVRPDVRVMLFTLAVSVCVGLFFGSTPAWFASRTDVNASLKLDGRGAGPVSRRRVLSAFVVSEVALALLLLVAAGLLLVSFERLRAVNPGFDPDNVLTMDIALPDWQYATPDARSVFFDRLTDTIRSISGVRAAGMVNALPLSGNNFSGTVTIEGRPAAPQNARLNANLRKVSSGYLEAMRVPLVKGRLLTDHDGTGPPVALINATMAERFFDDNPIGHRFKVGGPESPRPWMTVVGIVGDLHHRALDIAPRPEMYAPMRQDPERSMTLAVRVQGDPATVAPAIRRAVHSLDAGLPLAGLQFMRDVVDASTATQRFQTTLLVIFAAAALLLAMTGIYGVMAYIVSQRTRELGVRMALGASPRDLLQLVALEGLRLTGFGVAAGLTAALMATRILATMLFGVTATNLWVFCGATLALAVSAVVGSLVPARRASRVDPLVALGRG